MPVVGAEPMRRYGSALVQAGHATGNEPVGSCVAAKPDQPSWNQPAIDFSAALGT